ncbi:hypothetical protein PV325_005275 [Microctonus aethiopoides]|nr:hypothetical protein PV325_005275 [Microctonus aethiopoides]KAK0093701.1 hypothetical protein PV326_012870 [Microctonus aethiopoides]
MSSWARHKTRAQFVAVSEEISLVIEPRNADVCAEVAGEVTESLAAASLGASGHQFLQDNISKTIIIESNKSGDDNDDHNVKTWSDENKNNDDRDKVNDETQNQTKRINENNDNVNVENDGWCLKNWNDMPRHLQFNPHIKTGYRPLTNFTGCVKSLFYLHNETVNILTHGLATLHILLTVPNLLPWWDNGFFFGFISWCHVIGAVSPWIGSSLYHLFMNLNYGEEFYTKLLKLDMLGIWVCQSVGAVPMIAASVHCLPPAMRAKSPWERRLCFSPPFMMRMIFLTLRCFRMGGGAPDGFPHVVLQDLVAVIGGSIGALRIPEKWIPGHFDLILNSHNIMHVVVILAVWSMHAATLQDIRWMMNPSACLATYDSSPHHDEL